MDWVGGAILVAGVTSVLWWVRYDRLRQKVARLKRSHIMLLHYAEGMGMSEELLKEEIEVAREARQALQAIPDEGFKGYWP